MKGLKIIPMFITLMALAYLGIIFVRHNPDEVSVRLGQMVTPPAQLGFVILSSILAGMVTAGLLCSVELLVLYVQNQRLKRKLTSQAEDQKQLGDHVEKLLADTPEEELLLKEAEASDDMDSSIVESSASHKPA